LYIAFFGDIFVSDYSDLEAYREGDVALVLGNGLSINDMPQELLEKYESFGANYIHLCNVFPTYYVCIDTTVLVDNAPKIIDVASQAKIAFLSSFHDGSENDETKKLYDLGNIMLVHKDEDAFKSERFMSGHTSVYVCLKMAYYMGFRTVLMFGVDHDGGWKHCVEDYPSGVPTTEEKKLQMRKHFAYANSVYRSSGRKIINFSLRSQLDEIFNRGKLENWLD
jgi:hypothetical protein